MGDEGRKKRFVIQKQDIANENIFIRGTELHHLKNVLRLNSGDLIYAVFNNIEYKVKIIEINDNEAKCEILNKNTVANNKGCRPH